LRDLLESAKPQTTVRERLEVELKRLKHELRLGCELRIWWVPNGHSTPSGEVRGDNIFIYEANEDVAIESLKHEFIDYTISKVTEPYKEMMNKLFPIINGDAYRKRD
jgi:hypothetical protein